MGRTSGHMKDDDGRALNFDGRCIAVYMRLSHRSRHGGVQESGLKRAAELRGWARGKGHEVRWYKDIWTESSPRRPEWERLMRDVEAGRVGTLVCWRLDRIGKTCSELVKLFEFLGANMVNFVSLKDGMDLSAPEGRRMANALASVAVYETEVRAERIVAGQEAARARGIRWGGSEAGRRVKVTPEREAMVKRLRTEGEKISHIARKVGLSRTTIYKLLGESPPVPD